MTDTTLDPRDPRIDGPIGDAYAAYDSDSRVGGPDDFEAFADAIEPWVTYAMELENAIFDLCRNANAASRIVVRRRERAGIKEIE